MGLKVAFAHGEVCLALDSQTQPALGSFKTGTKPCCNAIVLMGRIVASAHGEVFFAEGTVKQARHKRFYSDKCISVVIDLSAVTFIRPQNRLPGWRMAGARRREPA